jgi:EAL domain-containing protein (putative c-di-GMP-specific phosphodiesterase class I)
MQLQTQESIMELAGRIDALMANGGLHLRCQMVTPISAGSVLLPYYEILLGITDHDGQIVPPMLFVPAIESLKRSHEIDIWVAKKVFAWIRANRALFSSIGGFSINLSALSLSHSEVLAFLLSELALADLPTEKIIFEITETAAIENYHVAREFMQQISSYGCKFSLDDFGSGYSSYSHLKNLRTCSLKIDGSFVKEMVQNPADYAMVKSMNDIGHSLGMKTVAEFVESAEILSMLREIGVDYAQGYIIHKPVPIDDLTSQQAL